MTLYRTKTCFQRQFIGVECMCVCVCAHGHMCVEERRVNWGPVLYDFTSLLLILHIEYEDKEDLSFFLE